MMFLLGKQAIFGHDPPTYFRPITATRCPFEAKVQAINFPPAPLPMITMSYSSVETFLVGDGDVFSSLGIRLQLHARLHSAGIRSNCDSKPRSVRVFEIRNERLHSENISSDLAEYSSATAWTGCVL